MTTMTNEDRRRYERGRAIALAVLGDKPKATAAKAFKRGEQIALKALAEMSAGGSQDGFDRGRQLALDAMGRGNSDQERAA